MDSLVAKSEAHDTDPMTTAPDTARGEPRTWQRDRLFYIGMAAAVILAVFAGFARTYYLKVFTGTPPLPPLVHLHGVLLTGWTFLLLAQTTLIARRRSDIHRRLGVAGAVLGVLIVVSGYSLAIDAARHGFRGQFPDELPPSADALAFLFLGLSDLLLFSILLWAGIVFRSRSDWHKRFMLLATVNLLSAAVLRIPIGSARLPVAFLLFISFAAAPALYDYLSRGRVHPVSLWVGLILILSFPMRPAIALSAAWHSIATWLTR